MNIPFLGSVYWSAKNGLIFCNTKGEVLVRTFKQTSDRYPALWRPVLQRVASPAVNRLLLLGLAGGGILPALNELLPQAAITAVEHDPVMISIARTLRSADSTPFPNTIVGDAFEILRASEETFDCIIVDLFLGMTLPAFLEQREFWDIAKQRLTPRGTIVLNIAGASYRGTAAEGVFSSITAKRVYDNTFILYA